MRKSLSNLENVQPVNIENVKGGKRYGLVNARTPEGAKLVRAFTKSGIIATSKRISATVMYHTNANGHDICIEW
jgi:hypothetical protein